MGLDLSLTSTGMSNGTGFRAIRTSPEDGSIEHRMNTILNEICDYMTKWDDGFRGRPDLAVVEGAAYGARGSAMDQLAGLRWLMRVKLHQMRIPFAVVSPTSLKRYVTRDGQAGKHLMTETLDHRHGLGLAGVKIKDGRYDMADALGLAAMGYDYLGHPLPCANHFPEPDRKTLDRVEWPFLYSN